MPYVTGAGGSFVTYDPGADGIAGNGDDVGLRALNPTTEYASGMQSGMASSQNVRLTASQSVTGSTTVNSLAIYNSTVNLLAGSVLRITSGAVSMSASGPQSLAFSGFGTLAFTTPEANIYTDSPSAGAPVGYVLDVQTSGASYLTKAGPGTLVLTHS